LRRSVSVIVLVLAAGLVGFLGPAATAATSATSAPAKTSAALSDWPAAPDEFGVRLEDVPVDEANNPRALRYVIDYLPTRTVIHRRILVINEEPQTAKLSVYADAAHITGGQFVGDTGATRSELTGWISVRHPRVTLGPGDSELDMVTVTVPKGATTGEHYGVVWVQQTSKPKPGSSFGVTEVSRVGVRLYLAVGQGGAPPTSFKVTSVTGRRSASGQPVVLARVSNTGGRAVDLNGSVSLTDGPGNSSSGPYKAQKIVTLAPGQSWKMTFSAPKSLPSGSWKAKVRLVSGLTKATGAATVRFGPTVTAAAAGVGGLSAMQWVWLALIALVVVLALVMGQHGWRRRRGQATVS
jgi:hypothetical protein